MFGSFIGNILGTVYFLLFQFFGILMSFRLFRKEKLAFRVLIGSVLGSVGIHWCPILFSFIFDFSTTSHICGIVLFILITLLVYILITPKKEISTKLSIRKQKQQQHTITKDSICNYPFLFVAIPLFALFCIMLWNHTILPSENGALNTGQCTYGDMNMHLGFITSLTNQQTFPPNYSLLPTTQLSYPFLSDAISSSVYIWGASLRYAYMLPMWVAILQVMFGMYAFAEEWLKGKWKPFLAFVLFFFNGGFGFIYFLNGTYSFSDLMNGFYETPTNLINVNIRWTNTIVDMLLPQRATLFGWALLFPVLCILLKGWTLHNRYYFIIAAFIAGALPMIHTHSFLALGMICFGWLIVDLVKSENKYNWIDDTSQTTRKTKLILAGICLGGLVLFSTLSLLSQNAAVVISANIYISLALIGVFTLFCLLAYYWIKAKKITQQLLLKTWGMFLILVLVLALPQLFYWTFRQVTNGEMLRGHFNWSNEGDIADPYLLYYLKNLGLSMLVFIPAWIWGKKKDLAYAFPSLIIWFVSELIVFQPNVYDNNKLLLAAYMILCCFIASALCNWFCNLKKHQILRYSILSISLILFTVSAILTMAREYYSGTDGHNYELYSSELVNACEFIEENTPADSVFLTANNHNNAVASLTGRNIVCGSSSFLYFHGIDYYDREVNLNNMYSSPKESISLFSEYDVKYVLVSSIEYNTYQDLNETELSEMFSCIYNTSQVRIYQVK